jgi:amino acid transporter
MNRTPIFLSLGGLALCVFGVYMMLRFATTPPFTASMSDHPNATDVADHLRQLAGPDVLGTYILLAASGFAVFATGLAMMFGRSRLA